MMPQLHIMETEFSFQEYCPDGKAKTERGETKALLRGAVISLLLDVVPAPVPLPGVMSCAVANSNSFEILNCPWVVKTYDKRSFNSRTYLIGNWTCAWYARHIITDV